MFYIRNIAVSGVVGSIWAARKREKKSANPIQIPTQFCDDFVWVNIGSHFGSPNRSTIDVDFECFLGGSLGRPLGKSDALTVYKWREGGAGER